MAITDVVVGIISLNEASTIASVTAAVDRGLQEFFPTVRALIVNADGRSIDGTKEAFLSASTETPKVYLPLKSGSGRKGENIQNLFNYAASVDSAATATVDGDLRSISPSWMRELIRPVLDGNCDLVYPIYERHRFDGTTTNLICYPVLYGLYLTDIRQPIGGDFGLSRGFVEGLRALQWPSSALGFGIDIMITTEAVMRRVHTCGAQLGKKIHRLRERATKGPMTEEVLDTLIEQIKRHRGALKSRFGNEPVQAMPFEPVGRDLPVVPVDVDAITRQIVSKGVSQLDVYKRWLPSREHEVIKTALSANCAPSIDNEMWCEILYRLLAAAVSARENVATIVAATIPLFFARMLTVFSTSCGMSRCEIEDRIRSEVKTFYRYRGLVLDDKNRIA